MVGRIGLAVFLVACTLGISADVTEAQIKSSEHASIAQTIDGTTVSLEYSRPTLRGRSIRGDLFGDQIRWGYVWTPGANRATKITSDNDFYLEGMSIPAGSYSVWMVVHPEEWTLVLDPDSELYHTQGPDETDEQFRTPIMPDSVGWSVESLSWTMPDVRSDGATLRMQWGDLAVDLDLKVEPTLRITMDPDEAAPYVGAYQVELPANEWREAHEFELELHLEDGLLLGEMEFSADFSVEVAFVQVADQVFRMGTLMNGSVTQLDEFWTFEFVLDEDGRAASFEARDGDDAVLQRATRSR